MDLRYNFNMKFLDRFEKLDGIPISHSTYISMDCALSFYGLVSEKVYETT